MKLLTIVLVVLAFSGFSQEINRTISAPSGNISGLAFGGGRLWCIDEETSECYGVNPSTGAIEINFEIVGPETFIPGGLAYHDGQVFCSFYNIAQSSEVFWYSETGEYGGFDELC